MGFKEKYTINNIMFCNFSNPNHWILIYLTISRNDAVNIRENSIW